MRNNFLCIISEVLLYYQCVKDVRLSLHFVGAILFCFQRKHGDAINAYGKLRSFITVLQSFLDCLCVCVVSLCCHCVVSVCG